MLKNYQQLQIKLVLIFLTFCLLISACNAKKNSESHYFLLNTEIQNQQLKLYKHKEQCALRINQSTSKLLNIPYPCGFVRASKNKIAQTYYYKDIGNVFVVAGPIVNKSDYSNDDGVKPEHFCSNQGQAIIVLGDSIIIHNAETVKLGFCHQLGFDEKGFYGYAYPIK